MRYERFINILWTCDEKIYAKQTYYKFGNNVTTFTKPSTLVLYVVIYAVTKLCTSRTYVREGGEVSNKFPKYNKTIISFVSADIAVAVRPFVLEHHHDLLARQRMPPKFSNLLFPLYTKLTLPLAVLILNFHLLSHHSHIR